MVKKQEEFRIYGIMHEHLNDTSIYFDELRY